MIRASVFSASSRGMACVTPGSVHSVTSRPSLARYVSSYPTSPTTPWSTLPLWQGPAAWSFNGVEHKINFLAVSNLGLMPSQKDSSLT